MIKRILVPTDGSETSHIGVRYAIALAKRCGATLLGLHVVDIKLLEGPFLRDLSASLGTAPYMNYQGNIAMILEERGRAALEVFRSSCEAAGVACDVELATGIVPREIAEHGELADLVVMGRGGEHGPWLEGLLGSTTEAVARRSRQPVLVTGTDTVRTGLLLAAYDGSDNAKHALRIAAQWASDWQSPLHVLVVGGPDNEHNLEQASEYLNAYDIETELVRRESEASETIVNYAREADATLLFMGAYGHSKVRELVLGSRTAFALNRAPCPVLLVR